MRLSVFIITTQLHRNHWCLGMAWNEWWGVQTASSAVWSLNPCSLSFCVLRMRAEAWVWAQDANCAPPGYSNGLWSHWASRVSWTDLKWILMSLAAVFVYTTCMPSWPKIPTPVSATWIILTSLAPSPTEKRKGEKSQLSSLTWNAT